MRWSAMFGLCIGGCAAEAPAIDASTDTVRDASTTDVRRVDAPATTDVPGRDVERIDSGGPMDVLAADVARTDTNATDAGNPDSTITFDHSTCTSMADRVGLTQRMAPTRSGGTIPYLSYVPSRYNPGNGHAVILALHGAGDMAMNYLSVVWRTPADSAGFVVIAPEASCAAGPGFTWCRDDPNSVLDALADFERCYSVDQSRRIVNGFSAGGIIAFAIGMQAANAFSGISIMAANLGSAEALSGRRLLPAPWLIPVSQFQGTMDMNFPIATVSADRDRMLAAGHTVYWHEFAGGHTTNAMFALTTYMDLAASRSPTGGR